MAKFGQSEQSGYNPRLKNDISVKSIIWLVIVCFFVFALGVGIIICAGLLKAGDSGLDNMLFHLWVGVPMVVLAMFGFFAGAIRSKYLIIPMSILSLLTMAVCVYATVSGGLYYWENDYAVIKQRHNDNLCYKNVNEQCVCYGGSYSLPKGDCDFLQLHIRLVISEISLAAFGAVFNFLAFLVSMLILCCGPWKYISDYEKGLDLDYTGGI